MTMKNTTLTVSRKNEVLAFCLAFTMAQLADADTAEQVKESVTEQELKDTLYLVENHQQLPEERSVGGWCLDDFRFKAEELFDDGNIAKKLSDEDLLSAMDLMQSKGDASIGFSWDTVEHFILRLFSDSYHNEE